VLASRVVYVCSTNCRPAAASIGPGRRTGWQSLSSGRRAFGANHAGLPDHRAAEADLRVGRSRQATASSACSRSSSRAARVAMAGRAWGRPSRKNICGGGRRTGPMPARGQRGPLRTSRRHRYVVAVQYEPASTRCRHRRAHSVGRRRRRSVGCYDRPRRQNRQPRRRPGPEAARIRRRDRFDRGGPRRCRRPAMGAAMSVAGHQPMPPIPRRAW